MTEVRPCVFCNIVAGTEPAKIRYLDEDLIVIVNRLDWVPLMLLVMPKKHLSQVETIRLTERLNRILLAHQTSLVSLLMG